MRSVFKGSGHVGRLAAACFMLVVAGCQSTDTAGLFNLGRGEERKPTVTAAELRAFCPHVALREGTAFYNTYTRDGKDDPTKIVHQASLTEVTRSCSFAGGAMTITVAAAGRVVPGPAAQAGTATLPIRVAVLRGEEILYSQLHQYPVAIAGGAGATQFVFTDPSVSLLTAADRGVRVYVGFDEGPVDPRRAGNN